MPPRLCFELTLKGFDGGTDETDHLIKWVIAPTRQKLDQWLKWNKLEHLVEDIEDMPHGNEYTFADGVDVVIDMHLCYTTAKPMQINQVWEAEVTAVAA